MINAAIEMMQNRNKDYYLTDAPFLFYIFAFQVLRITILSVLILTGYLSTREINFQVWQIGIRTGSFERGKPCYSILLFFFFFLFR